ncbi:MAG: hypothetical protein GWO08_06815, partial [Gammaproteobacteria bacterium]|nr:hypothetical protein [Gammaproteobacteria bacterium]NIT52016.1 hypothetical protein [candidate division Zixibacteria bacterium]NIW39950.1 hypothetical protein [candidate division Zixibacteria bacterium]
AVVSVCILFMGIYASSSFAKKIEGLYIEAAIEEMNYDLNFFSNLISNLYIKNDFVGIEQLLSKWSQNNTLDIEIEAVSANGFRLFYWQREGEFAYSKQASKRIE